MASISFKCPNCGGPLIIDPSTQQFKCEYCLSDFEESYLVNLAAQKEAEQQAEAAEHEASAHTDTAAQQEQSQDADQHDASEPEGAIYTCPSCGAELVTDDTTAATFCYYCHNPVVLSGRLSQKFRPNKVIPFAIDRETALSRFFEWTKKKRWIPKDFFREDQIEKLSGVYYPYWSGDFDVSGSFEGNGSVVSSFVMGGFNVTEVKKYRITRAADMTFRSIMRPALTKADRKLADGVHPFDMSAAKDFSTAYLSGFFAEKRDIESSQVGDDMKNELRSCASNNLRSSISGYTNVTGNSNIDFTSEKYDYVLLPSWVLTYKGRGGKMYYYAMNGQTGAICGKLPIDTGRLIRVCALISGAIFALLCAGGYFLW